jgi:HEPN domain-containing protein
VNIDEHIDYWIDTAEDDLETAESLLQNGYYTWSLFIGHLVLEKILKANWVKFNQNSNHPRIHNLLKLAQESGIEI